MKKPLVPFDSDILYQETTQFDFSKQSGTEYVQDLIDTCVEHKGYGLSDNQIGRNHSVFVFGIGTDLVPVFNPVITYYSDEKEVQPEGCLSFPGLVGLVPRSQTIRTKYFDAKGNIQVHSFTGLTARIFQHEYNHLVGIPFFNEFSKLKIEMMVKKCYKKNGIRYSSYQLAQFQK